jgi:hypothetical protein
MALLTGSISPLTRRLLYVGVGCATAAAIVATTFVVPSVSTSPAATGASPGARKFPSDVLNLKNWSLTLPTGASGNPEDITPSKLPTFSNKYFQLNGKRNGVIFNAPVGGVTTKNSKYPRSELREMTGEEKAAWSNTSGTHTLIAREAILAVPPVKPEIVTAQIHDGGDDVIQIRLEGKKLMVQYNDGKSEVPIDTNYKLGKVFDVKIVAANSKIEVYYNGKKKADIAKSGTGWYFKAGAYLQSNTEKGDTTGAPGKVAIYGLKVSHSGGGSGGESSDDKSDSKDTKKPSS